MIKAIAISPANINSLKSRFEIEDVTVPLEVGYFLVKDFGESDQPYEILTYTILTENFNILGRIKNGFLEVERKEY